MSIIQDIGDVKKRTERTEFEWIVTDIFSESKKPMIFSPTFVFANASWNLIAIFIPCIPKSEFRILQLKIVKDCTTKLQCSVKYLLGLKNVDSRVACLSRGILKENSRFSDKCYIKLSEVHQRKSEIAPSNTLTFTCTLKYEVSQFDQPEAPDLPKLMTLKRLNTLSDNFRSLFANKNTCDTTLNVMDKEYKAHKTILMARSSVFADMFSHETSENQTGIINIPDCDPESFEEFLEFLYTGKLEKPLSHSVFQLYEISDKYDVQELKTFCVEFLKESLTIENLCDSVIFAYKYDETDLLSATQNFFSENVNKVLESNEWGSFVKNNYSLFKTFLKEAWGKLKNNVSFEFVFQ